TTSAQLTISQINLLRAYCHLLWQVSKFATRGVLYSCLASNPVAAKLLWEMFALRFDPALAVSRENRDESFQHLLSHYRDTLQDVSDITFDRILRSLVLLLEHSLRTNYFLKLPCIAIKLHSEKIPVLPNPRPLYDVFVYSPQMQGTHLRSSKI